jgi:hypothetical protein
MPQLSQVPPTLETLVSYPMDRVLRVPTGSVMLERVEGVKFLPGFVLSESQDGAANSLPNDSTIWPARYFYENGPCRGGHYLLTRADFYQERLGLVVSEAGAIPCEHPLVELSGDSAGRTLELPIADRSRSFMQKPFIAGATTRFVRWQLVYEGRVGREILLQYKQFVEGDHGLHAQPEHYHQLSYDLSNTNTIRFREMEIQITDASNAGIAFRVTKDAGSPRRMRTFWNGQPLPTISQ